MLVNPSRSASSGSRTGAGAYVAPAEGSSIGLRELLSSIRRGPAWADRQLDRFVGEATEPADQRLFYAGDLGLLAAPCVSVVGSREASPAGLARASRLARELVERGVVVVSGLARGIDASAHRSAIQSGGRTVAVIGTPLEKASPIENAPLQEAIWRDHLLISPFPAGSAVQPSNFPKRNKVMAAVSDATVIVEAKDNSGALHQAVACQQFGRWLFILKSVVDAQSWPRRFLHIKNTIVLDRTDQIVDALRLQ
jgi:DNA processing protein